MNSCIRYCNELIMITCGSFAQLQHENNCSHFERIIRFRQLLFCCSPAACCSTSHCRMDLIIFFPTVVNPLVCSSSVNQGIVIQQYFTKNEEMENWAWHFALSNDQEKDQVNIYCAVCQILIKQSNIKILQECGWHCSRYGLWKCPGGSEELNDVQKVVHQGYVHM